jgi:hypothetical protein
MRRQLLHESTGTIYTNKTLTGASHRPQVSRSRSTSLLLELPKPLLLLQRNLQDSSHPPTRRSALGAGNKVHYRSFLFGFLARISRGVVCPV